jgi:CYTH domain-containing protein
MVEIERKFLINAEKWNLFPKPEPVLIKQGYLLNSPEATVRLRTKGDLGYLTIKGESKGISREEFEYQIPFNDVIQMFNNFQSKVLSKWRYTLTFENKIWEIDVFKGKLSGLILAEIELKSEDETFTLPPFIDEEVSFNPEYYNSNLIKKT